MRFIDFGLPIEYLKEQRREIADRWRNSDGTWPLLDDIRRLSDIQQCIAALEAVRAELDANRSQTSAYP